MKFWEHYDNDGKNESLKRSGIIMIIMLRMIVYEVLGQL